MEKIPFHATQRRLRASAHIRELTASVKLSHKNFIQPIFVDEAIPAPCEIKYMNGMQADTINTVLSSIEKNIHSGINKFLLFPVPGNKKNRDFDFSFAGAVAEKIKKHFGNDIWLAADVCLCSYTFHGHCGILNEEQTIVLNHATIKVLTEYSLLLCNSGVDCIAPSDMMDGRIKAIRNILDTSGYDHVSIMSYAAKFSSQLYGPFRDVCRSAPSSQKLTNRKTYQISSFNPDDAVASALRDEKEGADILMVKPAALYGDIISKIKQQTLKPVAAYHVSGEYAAIELLAQNGLVNREAAHIETWASLARSGTDIIISYAAKNAKKWIEEIEY